MPDPKKNFYVTTPIYYVNDLPHIGHAYTTIAADIVARFKRLDGYHVKFLTGTDEHGQKVEKAAHDKGVPPKDFVDSISWNFRNLATKLQSSHDDFIRTTEPRHAKAVKALWQRLMDRGQIYLGKYSGWYAIRDEAFYSADELIDGKAPTGAEVEWVTEPSYFFALSKWQEPLLRFYEENPNFIMPESRRNEVIRFVEGGLIDLSISRTSLTWGIPVPGDEQHIIYVWLDALSNYITAAGYPDNFDEALWNTAIHIVGKDILRFHAVYWPAFLMAAGLELPAQIFAHGWWTHEGQKISKSLGNTIDPIALVDKYGINAVRYFLFKEISFGQDGNFSYDALVGRMNSDLANTYGNLVQRVLSLVQKNLEGIVPSPLAFLAQDEKLLSHVDGLLAQVRQEMSILRFHRVCEHIWRLVMEANRYIDEEKPWILKNTDPERLKTVIYVLLEAIRKIALLTQPLLPEGSGKILDQLAIPIDQRTFAYWQKRIQPGVALPIPQGIFPRWVQTTT